jgi:hypothetical protein
MASRTARSTAASRSTCASFVLLAQVPRFRCHEHPHVSRERAWKLPQHSAHSRKPESSRLRRAPFPSAVRPRWVTTSRSSADQTSGRG